MCSRDNAHSPQTERAQFGVWDEEDRIRLGQVRASQILGHCLVSLKVVLPKTFTFFRATRLLCAASKRFRCILQSRKLEKLVVWTIYSFGLVK